ncbi:MAG: dihydrolipoyl dehydrogenase [Pseudomonadota bacterium]|nr:dihydrolipoyl dehydrogenase [Pseudomonadota bacterium]
MYDLTIIGAGPGGYVCAIRAAQLGLKVCCVDNADFLGGTCLNVGCIPSKALLESSHHYQVASKELRQHGVEVASVKLNLAQMMTRKNGIIKKLGTGIKHLCKKHHITVKHGLGKITNPQTVLIAPQNEKISSRHIVIATGSVPIALPNYPFDGQRIVSSTEALAFSSVPQRLAVLGGGVVGLEMASVWHRLGSKVQVIEAQPRLLPEMDAELSIAVAKHLQQQGIEVYLQNKLVKIAQNTLYLERGDKLPVDKLLVAVGRKPASTGIGLEELGVELDARGAIKVNSKGMTNVKNIYAIGDVCGGMMLAHKAEEEGVAVAENIAGRAGHVNYQAIPAVVYTFPEVASVGITEEQAQAQGIAVRIGKFPLRANGRAITAAQEEGFVKMISAADSDEMLGCHIFAAQASELIAEMVLAREYRASSEDIARTTHAHPTLSEALKEAALATDKRALHF